MTTPSLACIPLPPTFDPRTQFQALSKRLDVLEKNNKALTWLHAELAYKIASR